MDEHNNTFYVGLCMAGAVSAGAYTAGVLDYLYQALDNWERRKRQSNVPSHNVIIPVIGGASAGGMTGMIAATALEEKIEPVRSLNGNLMQEHPENIFYHAWVDMLYEDLFQKLLNSDDIKNGKIDSLLNSNFLDELTTQIISKGVNNRVQRPYIDPQLKLFVTLTNLKGLSYDFKLLGKENSRHIISRHNDYGAFQLNVENPKDGWIPLNFETDTNIELARDAAIATGAFPLGLRVRKLSRLKQYINDLKWHTDITKIRAIEEDPYETLIIDGGTINNEPFERVKELLDERVKELHDDKQINPDSTNFETFCSTTLLIDPFPSEAEKFNPAEDIFSVAGSTVAAMLSQLRTKPEILKEALIENNPSYFLIAPTKTFQNHKVEGSKAIASGFLAGFGGFLHKEFRIHDFFLGRANCERFLREHFAVPVNTQNPIFRKGYEHVDGKEQFMNSEKTKLQIIPLFEPEREKIYFPEFKYGSDENDNWPCQPQKFLKQYRKPLRKRVGKIILNIADLNWRDQTLLWIGNQVVLKRKIAKTIESIIYEDLRHHGLLLQEE